MYLTKEELEYILECINFTQSEIGSTLWQNNIKNMIEARLSKDDFFYDKKILK